ncbi:leucyl-tRNA synthetase [Tieghemostelium lacteum]|uniref:leucine--tRNA ligase n=1 Tax=Tieghemostelium lacteum TaxID=361077 RepID=A0A151ZHQ6_TIELA|nr:leucyl-tRNA synthetase [Tieghemostelium lacteum]|eukprot:KYQ93531.1 leucyl-tRNA synthetase [Tieghemostelium lacteum]
MSASTYNVVKKEGNSFVYNSANSPIVSTHASELTPKLTSQRSNENIVTKTETVVEEKTFLPNSTITQTASKTTIDKPFLSGGTIAAMPTSSAIPVPPPLPPVTKVQQNSTALPLDSQLALQKDKLAKPSDHKGNKFSKLFHKKDKTGAPTTTATNTATTGSTSGSSSHPSSNLGGTHSTAPTNNDIPAASTTHHPTGTYGSGYTEPHKPSQMKKVKGVIKEKFGHLTKNQKMEEEGKVLEAEFQKEKFDYQAYQHNAGVTKINTNLVKLNLIKRCYSTLNHQSINGSSKISDISQSKAKYYALSQFPYPSGALHMGHVRVYTMSDCIGRFKRMQGYDVIHPMGWDSFGLPAENAAIQKQISPHVWTQSNINSMKDQLIRLNLEFDWHREISTCSDQYYKWTQQLFIKLYQQGLAYRKLATVNWDPIDMTVLANEQVDAQGRSWRSNAIVEKKDMSQWFFKITSMADRLHDDLDLLPGWSDEIKSMQKEWIGRSKGHYLDFILNTSKNSKISVFTTRIETLYGVTFLAISSKHPILKDKDFLMNTTNEKKLEISNFIQMVESNQLRNIDELCAIDTGHLVQSPNANLVRLIISSTVLSDYGTGAVMGVPAHNKQDYLVAKKLSLPIVQVLERQSSVNNNITSSSNSIESECFDSELTGKLIQSGNYSQWNINDVIDDFERKGWGKPTISYRIRDWLISRQRYWGTPIPIIHCPTCGTVPVPENELPVLLPIEVQFTGKGNILNDLSGWKQCKCPICLNNNAQRETDTMDTFVDSSWYYLRFLDNQNQNEIFSSTLANNYMPVDIYVGGIEHAILHLLYSRFITKFLYDQSLISHKEPFKVLLTQGLVKSPTYRDQYTLKPLHPSDVLTDQKPPISKLTGNPVNVTIEKMSKSKLNGLDPSEMIDKYGSDTLKVYILFKAPPENSLEWDNDGIDGCKKWLKRVDQLISNFIVEQKASSSHSQPQILDEKELKSIEFQCNQTISRVSESIENYTFNTAISSLMTLSNFLQKVSDNTKCHSIEYFKSLRTLLLLLTPFAPITAQYNWDQLVRFNNDNQLYSTQLNSINLNDIKTTSGDLNEPIITKQNWPKSIEKYQQRENLLLVVQFNAKTRAVIELPSNISEKTQIEQFVRNSPKFANRFNTSYEKIFLGTTKNGYSINFTN